MLSKFWGREFSSAGMSWCRRALINTRKRQYPLMSTTVISRLISVVFRTTPPDPDLKSEYSERFNLPCYNRIQQEEAYKFYQKWISDDLPRYLVVEIEHANPYYDDSYAVNSANLGPYGDAITYEFIPALEKKFRGLGYGLGAVPVRRFDRRLGGARRAGQISRGVQRRFAACPDPIDFRHYIAGQHLRGQERLLPSTARWQRRSAPGHRNYLGDVSARCSRTRTGWSWCWATRTAPAAMGYLGGRVSRRWAPTAIRSAMWDKATGADRPRGRQVLAASNYDLRHILERDWQTLGTKLEGQDQPLRRRHGQLLSEQRRLSDGGLPRRPRSQPTAARWSTVIAPSIAGTATQASQRHLPAALQHLLSAQDPETDRGDCTARGRPQELALLRTPVRV